jgi:hypothetical protein
VSTLPNGPPKRKSIKKRAVEDSFQQGLTLLKESKSITTPALRTAAEKAAVRLFIKDTFVPLSPLAVLSFVTVLTLAEAAVCVVSILKLPIALSTAIVVVTACFWFTLVAIALALGGKLSEATLAKLMTTAFGKIIEKFSLWRSKEATGDEGSSATAE